MARSFRLGTRGSPLARWQAEWVAARLREHGVAVELILITTQGDVRTGPLGQIGGEGLFTKEIQRALLADEVDLAVHSLKDLPTTTVPDLALAAVPPREGIRDVLVSAIAKSLAELPQGAKIGTGSLRRRAQLLHLRPDLQLFDIRGNIDTRLQKLDAGEYHAILLAEAGLRRLGLASRIAYAIPPETMLPAVGQGALGIETRANDTETRQAVSVLNDPETFHAVTAERALLAALRAGCLAPVGAWGRLVAGQLQLDAVVVSPDGREKITATVAGEPTAAHDLGEQAGAELIALGAAAIIAGARSNPGS